MTSPPPGSTGWIGRASPGNWMRKAMPCCRACFLPGARARLGDPGRRGARRTCLFRRGSARALGAMARGVLSPPGCNRESLWNEALGVDGRYPRGAGGLSSCETGRRGSFAQSHLSRLGAEDCQPLHQRNDGEHVFPMQVVALLSAPGEDFQGGEFVMTEQRRACNRGRWCCRWGWATRPSSPPPGVRSGQPRLLPRQPQARRQPRARRQRIGLEVSFHDAR